MSADPPFGDWMRRRRVEMDLTQEQLGALVGCAGETIRALESGRRRASRPMAERLAAALRIAPAQREQFVRAARSAGTEARPAQRAAQHNLPAQLSSFVGRRAELARVRGLLAARRLVTLTGAGGSGKTRLALAVAAELLDEHPDGVWLVELAGLGEPALVPDAVARALGLRPEPGADPLAALVEALRARRTLVVLDNCEHLVEACARLAEALLLACPELHICATSREALRVPGEYVYPVPTLPAPPRALPAHEIARYDAVSLFLDRAAAHQPAFALTAANAPAVADICARLDGIPLAIELAAARLRSMSPQQIVERLHNSLRLLTAGSRTVPPRQQTMRGTIDWSYSMLDEAHRQLFRRVSVFAGGWDLSAAEVVGASFSPEAPPVADGLARLVEQSLVVLDEPDERGMGRYRLLEPVRQYATEQLAATGEAGAISGRHAAVYLAMAEQARPELRRGGQVTWLNQLGRDRDNLRAAIGWALQSGDGETAGRIVWSLWPFWWIRNQHREGRRWAEAVLAHGEGLEPRLRARVTMAAEAMAYGLADDALVERYARSLLAHARGTGDEHAEAYAQAGFGLVAVNRGDLGAAIGALELALPLFARSEEEGMAAQAHTWIGTVLLLRGEHGAARERFERGLAAGRAIGDRLAITNALYNLGQIALAAGDWRRAAEQLRAGIPLSREMSDWGNLAFIVEGLAVAAAADDPARAARLFGAAAGLIDRVGLRGHSYYQPDRELYLRARAQARAGLGEARADALEAEGRAMAPAEALALAEEGGGGAPG